MSPNTVAAYVSDVEAFLQTVAPAAPADSDKTPALAENSPLRKKLSRRPALASGAAGTEWKDIDASAVSEYLASRSDDISKRSQARILSSLRSFFDWLIIEGECPVNPCDRVEAPKAGRYLPEVLSVGEVEQILGSVDTSTWQGARDRALLEANRLELPLSLSRRD